MSFMHIASVAAIASAVAATVSCEHRSIDVPSYTTSETLARIEAEYGERADAGEPTNPADSSSGTLKWMFTSAANPLGWADRAERRCDEGFCAPAAIGGGPAAPAGGVECMTPSGAPYVAERC